MHVDDDLPARIEQILLGGERRYNRVQAAAAAGVTPAQATELWRSLGFANVGDDEVVFTDGDANALRTAFALVKIGLTDQNLLSSIARMLGQMMARTASWQSQVLLDLITQRPDSVPGGDLVAFIEQVVPALEQVQAFVWRRHLAALTERAFTNAVEQDESHPMVVGFVDLAGYTNFSRRVDAVELTGLLENFESSAAFVVTEHQGRVVKSLGDEVLFVADDAASAADIALGLLDRNEADEQSLPLHIGMASGSVLRRFGDVFGSVVNIASRLTSVSRPGSILIDRELAEQLQDDSRYNIQRLRSQPVRGYHNLTPYRLRRSRTADVVHTDEIGPLDVIKRLRIWE